MQLFFHHSEITETEALLLGADETVSISSQSAKFIFCSSFRLS